MVSVVADEDNLSQIKTTQNLLKIDTENRDGDEVVYTFKLSNIHYLYSKELRDVLA